MRNALLSVGHAVVLATVLAATGCGESSSSPKVVDPALYEPPIVREGEGRKPSSAKAELRTLKPAFVSGVAMAPRSLLDDKLRMLVPQTFTQMPADRVAELFGSGARPDAVFQSADRKVFLVVVLLRDPLLPDQVRGAFESTKKTMLAAYPDCTERSETILEVDGRPWMRFDLDGAKRVMVAVTSLDGKTLRIEASFVDKPEQKWVDAIRRSWETAVLVDGHS
jgi:hypothetical protein